MDKCPRVRSEVFMAVEIEYFGLLGYDITYIPLKCWYRETRRSAIKTAKEITVF
jgi:hypothetical protein